MLLSTPAFLLATISIASTAISAQLLLPDDVFANNLDFYNRVPDPDTDEPLNHLPRDPGEDEDDLYEPPPIFLEERNFGFERLPSEHLSGGMSSERLPHEHLSGPGSSERLPEHLSGEMPSERLPSEQMPHEGNEFHSLPNAGDFHLDKREAKGRKDGGEKDKSSGTGRYAQAKRPDGNEPSGSDSRRDKITVSVDDPGHRRESMHTTLYDPKNPRHGRQKHKGNSGDRYTPPNMDPTPTGHVAHLPFEPPSIPIPPNPPFLRSRPGEQHPKSGHSSARPEKPRARESPGSGMKPGSHKSKQKQRHGPNPAWKQPKMHHPYESTATRKPHERESASKHSHSSPHKETGSPSKKHPSSSPHKETEGPVRKPSPSHKTTEASAKKPSSSHKETLAPPVNGHSSSTKHVSTPKFTQGAPAVSPTSKLPPLPACSKGCPNAF